MRRLLLAVLLGLHCFPLFAAENALFGKWLMSSDQGVLVVTFSESDMTMASPNPKTKAQTVKVKYKQLDKTWGIELLGENGAVQGSMMAILLSPDLLRLGSPGESFFELRRVR